MRHTLSAVAIAAASINFGFFSGRAEAQSAACAPMPPDGRLGCIIPGVNGTDWVPGELAGKGV